MSTTIKQEILQAMPALPATFSVRDVIKELQARGVAVTPFEAGRCTVALYALEKLGYVKRAGRIDHNALLWRRAATPERITVPRGTVVRVQGLLCELLQDAEVRLQPAAPPPDTSPAGE